MGSKLRLTRSQVKVNKLIIKKRLRMSVMHWTRKYSCKVVVMMRRLKRYCLTHPHKGGKTKLR